MEKKPDNFIYLAILILAVFLGLSLYIVFDEGRRSDKESERHRKAGHAYITYAGEKYGRWCTYSATTGQWVGVIETIK